MQACTKLAKGISVSVGERQVEKWKEVIPSRGIKKEKVLGKGGGYRTFVKTSRQYHKQSPELEENKGEFKLFSLINRD